MPVEISDWNDFDNVRNDLDGNYVLVNDLDGDTDGYDTVAGPNANGGDGFEPIGPLEIASGFSGDFDGQGYKISDLIIDRRDKTGERYTAIFTRVNTPTIENLTVENVDIKVNSDENSHGVIIGGDDTGFLLQNCSTTGSLLQEGSGDRASGMVAQVFSNGTIENCASHVDVASEGNDRVGGLVGFFNDGVIERSYATGSVEASDRVGGLAGENGSGTITDSYATGSVEADNRIAGLVGFLNGGTIERSYATGLVEGATAVAGLVVVNSGTVTDSYWDTEATGQDTSDGGTGLTTSEMQGSEAETNMSGFDFADVWDSVLESDDDTTGDGYPILISLGREDQLEAQGIFDGLEPPEPPANLTAGLL